MKTILELLIAGEYAHTVTKYPSHMTTTRGLWICGATITIDAKETIHGNPLKIECDWLQVGATEKRVVEEFTFIAHGRSNKIPADRMIEELRKHI